MCIFNVKMFFKLAVVLCFSAAHLFAKTVEIENKGLKISMSDNGQMELLVKGTKSIYRQLAPAYEIKNIRVKDNELLFDIKAELLIGAKISLVDDSSFELTLSAIGKQKQAIAYPPAWKMQKKDTAIYPISTGYAFPVETEFMGHKSLSMVCGVLWSMSLTAFERNGEYVISAVKLPYDAQVRNFQENNLAHSAILWRPQKGEFAYDKTIRFFVGTKIGPLMAKYRQWRNSVQPVKSLSEKARENPNVNKLKGAASFWIWRDNYSNEMYGRPPITNEPKRDIRKIISQMDELGIDNVFLNNIEDELPEDIEYIKAKGYLSGHYDLYRDVLPANIVDKIVPVRVKFSEKRTKYWPDVVCISQDKKPVTAWKVHGLDGNMYDQQAVCDVCALYMTKEIAAENLRGHRYNARFIDVQATSPLQECYSEKHPATRTQSANAIIAQNEYLHRIGLVNGVECGHELFVGSYDYAEGLLNAVPFRNPDSGRKQTDVLKLNEIPKNVTDYMFNAKYRFPIWDLAYHDCAVQYWYWGDTPANYPDIMNRIDALNALYGYPPLYSFKLSNWDLLKDKIAKSYKNATAVARKVAFEKMVDFEYLTKDKTVQKTTFSNGVSVVANFGESDYVLPNNKTLKPFDVYVEEK